MYGEAPPHYILDASDCDDVDPNINPEVREDYDNEGFQLCKSYCGYIHEDITWCQTTLSIER